MHWFKKFLVLSRSRNILANEICQRKFGRIKGASAVDVTGIARVKLLTRIDQKVKLLHLTRDSTCGDFEVVV